MRASARALILVLLGPLAGAASAQDTQTVAAAEFAFAQAARDTGIRAAFLKYLAPDSMVCGPAPAAGVELYSRRPAPQESPPTLEWYPVLADSAASDDLGYTSGPWVLRSGNPTRELYGTVLSVWNRQPDGAWRVVLDCGVAHEKAPMPPPMKLPDPPASAAAAAGAADAPAPRSAALVPRTVWRDPVAAAEQRYAAAVAAHGAEEALAQFAAPEVRVLHQGALPAQGVSAARALLHDRPIGRHWQHAFARDSRDGLLGYAWGFAGAGDAERPTTAYVNVWRRSSPTEPWRIVAQVHQTLPPPAPQAGEKRPQ